jgi:hypothetical protein
MIEESAFEQVYKSEGYGAFPCGIDIRIASPEGATEGVQRAARQAAELLEQQITRDFYANNTEAQERARTERRELLACFPSEPIFVQPIPNGYCDRACCEHLPWFQVTTRIGVITLGWRKRVINIDWIASTVTAKADELFPDEDVTKFERTIHAWGYEKAREYIGVLLNVPEAGTEER